MKPNEKTAETKKPARAPEAELSDESIDKVSGGTEKPSDGTKRATFEFWHDDNP